MRNCEHVAADVAKVSRNDHRFLALDVTQYQVRYNRMLINYYQL